MHTVNAARRAAPWALGLALSVLAAPAFADEARERELERRLEALEREIAQLRENQRGSASNELEARVAELEHASKLSKDGLFPYWSSGLRADAADKKRFNFKFGGRVMNDYVVWSSDRDTEAVVGDQLTTAAEIRRARIYFAGTIYGNIFFKTQYDFAGGDADINDMYIGTNLAGGKVIVGHQFMPFGLQQLTSSKYITFMERAPHQAFGPARETGITYTANREFDGGDMRYGVGVFRDANSFGDDLGNTGEGEYGWAGRVSVRPWVDEENEQYLNFGGSVAMYNFDSEMTRVRARPQVHTGPRFVDTGTFMAKDGGAYELDAALVTGPFHVMTEWMCWEADSPDTAADDPEFDGMTVQAGLFLTGESRPWKNGAFGRVKPKKNYGDEGGCGAWEVAARWSTIDLDDGNVRGGEMDIWSIGLNWYLNPNTRVMLNWENIDLDRDDGAGTDADDVSAVMVRFALDF